MDSPRIREYPVFTKCASPLNLSDSQRVSIVRKCKDKRAAIGISMTTAAIARITALILIAMSAAGCGGGGGGAGNTTPPPSSPTQTIASASTTQNPPPMGPAANSTATLWLGNVVTLGAAATVADAAPTSSFAAGIISNATVPTTYYVRGNFTNNGIASIQGTVSNGVVSYTIMFKSPSSLGLGIYNDTITMHGCYDS